MIRNIAVTCTLQLGPTLLFSASEHRVACNTRRCLKDPWPSYQVQKPDPDRSRRIPKSAFGLSCYQYPSAHKLQDRSGNSQSRITWQDHPLCQETAICKYYLKRRYHSVYQVPQVCRLHPHPHPQPQPHPDPATPLASSRRDSASVLYSADQQQKNTSPRPISRHNPESERPPGSRPWTPRFPAYQEEKEIGRQDCDILFSPTRKREQDSKIPTVFSPTQSRSAKTASTRLWCHPTSALPVPPPK